MEKGNIEKKADYGEKIDVVFCGLIREKERFKNSINDLVLLRKQGFVNQIILSTWDYEVKNNPEIVSFLKDNGAIILPNKEPKFRGFGNINCQMKTLEEGLKKVKSPFVLKTRADIYIDPSFLEHLFKNKEKLLKIKLNLPNGNIFQYKFWIPYFEITKPFYLSDEAYFGYYKDHKLLINY